MSSLISGSDNFSSSATVTTVNTIVDLLAYTPGIGAVKVKNYHADVNGGGGYFYWDATYDKALHNGGTIIDPLIVFPIDWTNQTQLTTWLTPGIGTGCWVRIYDGPAHMKWFGAKATAGTDDTLICQTVLDDTNIQELYFEPTHDGFQVTQLSIRTGKREIFGSSSLITGIATTATRSILELKQGLGLHLHDILLNAGQKQNYETGFHWYTNDLNTYFPGKATIYNLWVNEALLGFTVGALPSQGTAYYAQGTVQLDGIATDAPLSECVCYGWRATDCPAALYMNQPNGKLTIENSYLAAEGLGWTTAPAQTTWKALKMMKYGELALVGGSLEGVQTTSGRLIEQEDCNLSLESVITESQSPSVFVGNSRTRFSKLANAGFNSTSGTMIWVDQNATGTLSIDNSWIVMPAQANAVGTSPNFIKGVSDGVGTFAPANEFRVNLSNVELRDVTDQSGGAWRMAILGVKAYYDMVTVSSYDATGTKLKSAKLSTYNDNALDGIVDTAFSTVSAYPQTVGATSGGWTFAVSATGSWGSQIPSAGLNLETINSVASTPTKVLRLNVTSGTITATSADFGVSPYDYITVTGRLYCSTISAAQVGVQLISKDFSGATISNNNLTIGADTTLPTSTWIPFLAWGQTAANAAKADIAFYAEGGTDIQFSNPRAVVTEA